MRFERAAVEGSSVSNCRFCQLSSMRLIALPALIRPGMVSTTTRRDSRCSDQPSQQTVADTDKKMTEATRPRVNDSLRNIKNDQKKRSEPGGQPGTRRHT